MPMVVLSLNTSNKGGMYSCPSNKSIRIHQSEQANQFQVHPSLSLPWSPEVRKRFTWATSQNKRTAEKSPSTDSLQLNPYRFSSYNLTFLNPETRKKFNKDRFGERLLCLRVYCTLLILLCGVFLMLHFCECDPHGLALYEILLFAVILLLLAFLRFLWKPRGHIWNTTNLLAPACLLYLLVAMLPLIFLLIEQSHQTHFDMLVSQNVMILQIPMVLVLNLPFWYGACGYLVTYGSIVYNLFQKDVGGSCPYVYSAIMSGVLLTVLVFGYPMQRSVIQAFVTKQKLEEARTVFIEERSNDKKRQYVCQILHELGTPLMALGMGNDALRFLQPSNDDQAKELKWIIESNESALGMMKHFRENVLDLAKNSEGKSLVPLFEPLDVKSVVRKCRHLMTGFNSVDYRKKVKMRYKVDWDVPKYIMSDKDFLWDMLCSLIGNAKKFTQQGTIETHVAFDTSNKEIPKIYFEVADTGIGVKEEHEALLFKRFTQFQSNAGGAGLGLFSVKLKAEALGGSAGYVSRKRKGNGSCEGSIFWFSIPYIEVTDLADDAMAHSTGDRRDSTSYSSFSVDPDAQVSSGSSSLVDSLAFNFMKKKKKKKRASKSLSSKSFVKKGFRSNSTKSKRWKPPEIELSNSQGGSIRNTICTVVTEQVRYRTPKMQQGSTFNTLPLTVSSDNSPHLHYLKTKTLTSPSETSISPSPCNSPSNSMSSTTPRSPHSQFLYHPERSPGNVHSPSTNQSPNESMLRPLVAERNGERRGRKENARGFFTSSPAPTPKKKYRSKVLCLEVEGQPGAGEYSFHDYNNQGYLPEEESKSARKIKKGEESSLSTKDSRPPRDSAHKTNSSFFSSTISSLGSSLNLWTKWTDRSTPSSSGCSFKSGDPCKSGEQSKSYRTGGNCSDTDSSSIHVHRPSLDIKYPGRKQSTQMLHAEISVLSPSSGCRSPSPPISSSHVTLVTSPKSKPQSPKSFGEKEKKGENAQVVPAGSYVYNKEPYRGSSMPKSSENLNSEKPDMRCTFFAIKEEGMSDIDTSKESHSKQLSAVISPFVSAMMESPAKFSPKSTSLLKPSGSSNSLKIGAECMTPSEKKILKGFSDGQILAFGPPPESTGKVLLIEDCKVVAKMICHNLKKRGFEVKHAENGEVGLQYMKISSYLCIFCDLTMPVMDGFTAVREYRRWEKTHRPNIRERQYICALSANGDEITQKKALDPIEGGFDKFLSKPVDIDQLVKEIQSQCKKSTTVDADSKGSQLPNVHNVSV